MLFNQSDAEEYAIALIQGDNSFKPKDKFIDYIINMKDGYVLFTEHYNSEITFGYFPDNQKALDDKELQTGNAAIDEQRGMFVSGQALQGPNVLIKRHRSAYSNYNLDTTTGYVLDISKEGEAKITAFYKNLMKNSKALGGNRWLLPDQYSFLGENCADLASEAAKAGMPWYDAVWLSSAFTSPFQLEAELKVSPWLVNEVNTYGQN